MTNAPAHPRVARTSTGSAIAGTVLTLLIFVAVFISFLVAPLVVLLVALLAYLAMRGRTAERPRPAPVRAAGPAEGRPVASAPGAPLPPASGFGSGVRR